MALTTTIAADDLTDGKVPTGTRFVHDVRSPEHVLQEIGAYAEYQAYLATPGDFAEAPGVAQFAEVADPASVKLHERFYVKCRFRVKDENGVFGDFNDEWLQLNATNFPTMDLPAHRLAFKMLYDQRRIDTGLVPAP